MKGITVRNRKRKILLLLADLVMMLAMTALSAVLVWPLCSWLTVAEVAVALALALLFYMYLLHVYRPVWRFAGPSELLRLLNSHLLTAATALAADAILGWGCPVAFILLATALAALVSAYFRIIYKSIYHSRSQRIDGMLDNNGRRPIAIVGAGDAGVALLREFSRSNKSPYYVWGFFDDDKAKIGMAIDGVPILGSIDNIPKYIKASHVHDLVLAIPSLALPRRREIIRICNGLNCKLKIMPDIILSMEDHTGKLTESIRDVKIEDLLGRSSVSFKDAELTGFFQARTVLVTGGGGSIGSELCRQIAASGADNLVIFDVAENTSYLLQKEIQQEINSEINIVVEIGSMTDRRRVQDVFRHYRPQIVFHAAAHKHVPLMEHCPYEAVQNNILGTYNVATVASAEGVEKFVLISTDKAVKPTSVMGATKRYCENMLLALSRQPRNKTCFVAVRFGNVLGSAGSVIPIFQQQIANGGPVTITDFRITRYFMTISEAVGLVLKSAAMASSSETFILDMGKPMRILELAENLIRLCDMEPYKDIAIIETGLRPGEKLYEELLVSDDSHIATRASKIFIEKNTDAIAWDTVEEQLSQLREAIQQLDNAQVLELLHLFLPDYQEPELAEPESAEPELAEPEAEPELIAVRPRRSAKGA